MNLRRSGPESAERLVRKLLTDPLAGWPTVVGAQPELLAGSFDELDACLRSLIADRLLRQPGRQMTRRRL
jgi:hypothetical protein